MWDFEIWHEICFEISSKAKLFKNWKGFWLYYGSHKSSTYSDQMFHNSKSEWVRVVPYDQKKSKEKLKTFWTSLRWKNSSKTHVNSPSFNFFIISKEFLFLKIYDEFEKSFERSQSNRRFPYGYLVTTSPQLLIISWLQLLDFIEKEWKFHFFLCRTLKEVQNPWED